MPKQLKPISGKYRLQAHFTIYFNYWKNFFTQFFCSLFLRLKKLLGIEKNDLFKVHMRTNAIYDLKRS